MPVTSRLGWRTEFPWARYEQWADGSPVRLLERRELPPLGHFWLIRFARLNDSDAKSLLRPEAPARHGGVAGIGACLCPSDPGDERPESAGQDTDWSKL